LNKSNLNLFDFAASRFLVKLFEINDIHVITIFGDMYANIKRFNFYETGLI